jgi:hypothetical protein
MEVIGITQVSRGREESEGGSVILQLLLDSVNVKLCYLVTGPTDHSPSFGDPLSYSAENEQQ